MTPIKKIILYGLHACQAISFYFLMGIKKSFNRKIQNWNNFCLNKLLLLLSKIIKAKVGKRSNKNKFTIDIIY